MSGMRAVRLLAVVALGMALVACAARPPFTVVKVTLSDFKYSSKVIEIPAGQKVGFEMTNVGTTEHDVMIHMGGFHYLIQPGATVRRNVGPLPAGEYQVQCTIPGHKELGMSATLVVR